jgi:small subunit ribosomal protein S2
MSRLPDAIFVVDTRKEKIRGRRSAQAEDPGHRHRRHQLRSRRGRLRHSGNDDALRAIRLFASKVADAISGGRAMRESRIAEEDAARAEEAAAADAAARLTRAVRPQRRTEPTPAGA